MTTQSKGSREPQESDLLVPFERNNIRGEYKEYYKTKRHNLFASIQNFPELWEYHNRLDEIWSREFNDLRRATDTSRVFPLMLFLNAHAKIRIGIELAFSCCMAEARSILRDAIECVAHGHKMVGDTTAQEVWLSKDPSDRASIKAFEDVFERNKKTELFKGLDELHRTWGELSETGAHTTVLSMCDRVIINQTEQDMELGLNYTGVNEVVGVMSIFSLLLTCATMEQTFFADYEGRLKLDPVLVQKRSEFHKFKEQLRKQLIVRYKLERPTTP